MLFLLLCITLLPFIGLIDFHTKGEPREAVVALSMLESGNWILPTNIGGDLAYKPPFYHWFVALVSLPFGEVTEFSSRLPSTLSLIAMSIFFFTFFAKRIDSYRSFIATLVFVTSFEVHRAGMNARVDMVLTAAIVLAIMELYKWWENGMKGIPFWSVLFMSIGTLTKGPVGFLLPCGSLGLFLLLNHRNFFYVLMKMGFVAILSCILPAVWYVLAYMQGGQIFLDLVIEENFGRFLGKMSYESHENPAIYNVFTMITGYIPWTLLMLISLFTLHYRKAWRSLGLGMDNRLRNFWKDIKEWYRKEEPVKIYALVSALVIFVFYCIPKSKRSVYLLPVYPFVAIYITDYIIWLQQNRKGVMKTFNFFISGVIVIAIALWGVLRFELISIERYKTSKAAIKAARYAEEIANAEFSIIGIACIVIALCTIGFFIYTLRNKNRVFISATFALVFGLQFMLDGTIQPVILNHKSIKNFSHQIEKEIGNEPIYQYIGVDMLRFYITNFYIHNRIKLFETENPDHGYLMVGIRDFEVFKEKYGNEYEFKEVMRSPHNDTEIKDYILLYKFKKASAPQIMNPIYTPEINN